MNPRDRLRSLRGKPLEEALPALKALSDKAAFDALSRQDAIKTLSEMISLVCDAWESSQTARELSWRSSWKAHQEDRRTERRVERAEARKDLEGVIRRTVNGMARTAHRPGETAERRALAFSIFQALKASTGADPKMDDVATEMAKRGREGIGSSNREKGGAVWSARTVAGWINYMRAQDRTSST